MLLALKNNSKTMVDMITGNARINGKPPTLVRHIQELLELNWEV
jgi:hypothetical protein